MRFPTTILLLALLVPSVSNAEPASEFPGFFGQRLGEKLIAIPTGIYKGSINEPSIHYVVAVPNSFPIKYFKTYVAVVDTESGIVGGLYANVAIKDGEDCGKKESKLLKYMSQIYTDEELQEKDGAFSNGKLYARVSCVRPISFDFTYLTVSVSNFAFNRDMEDKYINRSLKLNE